MTRKDPTYRAFINDLPCALCGNRPSECAHVRLSVFGSVVVSDDERGGIGLKPADRWSVPLCHEHHAIQHSSNRHNGGERDFWERRDMNPLALCQALYRNRDNRGACLGILDRARMGATL